MKHVVDPSRPRLLFLIFAIFAVAILGRALYLQYFAAEANLERAGWKTESELTLTAPRGAIWDRRKVPLAESVEAYNLALDARLFYSQKRAFKEELVTLFEGFDAFDKEKFLSYADLGNDDIPRFMRVARGISPREAEAIKHAATQMGTNAIIFQTTYDRYYPLSHVAGSLLGFVDRDGVQGRAGLESGLDERLRGGELSYRVVRDVRRDPYLLGELPDMDAIRGRTVELTIDARLQQFTEQTLQDTMEQFNAKEALAVVSNVKTGELLSIASVPTIDPADPFASDEEYVWSPHALSYAIEPGSTAKVLTYAFAMDSGVMQPNTTIDCEGGSTEVDGHTIRDTHDEDVITAHKVLEVSSNVGSWKMASAIGAERHRHYLEKAGIGQRPDLPISGATRGILPKLKWLDIHHANISFGHGFSVSIVQLHNAIAAIANGGVRLKPRVVRAFHYGDGSVEKTEREVVEHVVSEAAAKRTLEAMVTAVYGEDGTGKAAQIQGVEVAGKTGTARLVDLEKGGYMQEYLGSFSGVFPADNPQYAITVWVLQPDKSIAYYGARVAAPAFKAIGEEVLRLYSGEAQGWAKSEADARSKLSPSKAEVDDKAKDSPSKPDEEEQDAPQPRAVPPLIGERASDAVRTLRQHDMPVKIYGNGRVATQKPAAGEALAKGDRVVLQLAPEDM